MEKQRKAVVAVCSENQGLATYMYTKWQEMAQSPKGLSENTDLTLHKAYSNVCNSKTPIKTLRDFSQIKGVGKWILRLMQGFFDVDSTASDHEDLPQEGKKTGKAPKRYMPQKNSVAYALLITLYRGTVNGHEFMRKQELIDAAEASGLSRVPIGPEKGKGKPGNYGSSPREWYSGWNCMKTLITKGLVVKSSCPAKYMLTEEGKEAARDCLLRSGINDENLAAAGGSIHLDRRDTSVSALSKVDIPDTEFPRASSVKEVALPTVRSSKQKQTIDIPSEYLDKFIRMGFTKEQTIRAFHEVSEACQGSEITSLWPTVLCRLREDQVYGMALESTENQRDNCFGRPGTYKYKDDVGASQNALMNTTVSRHNRVEDILGRSSEHSSYTLNVCSSSNCSKIKQNSGDQETNLNVLATPPLVFGERFEDAYDVILILDDREQFATQGSRSRKIIENIRTQFKIQIEVRRLPVGDGVWIARHKHLRSEYVLDFIVERKKVDDLRHSIRDNRYRDQKLRLLRCGLKKLIYLVEGDPNSCEAAESIKTACFTTEILEGFDVQRTSGLADTLRKYGYLTQAIDLYYRSMDNIPNTRAVCPPFDEFVKRCEDLDKMTVSDVFAIQLMQVPQVTEEVAVAVLNMYPTLLSLAHAYSKLDGDISAQEEMLKKQSCNLINGAASKNIFQLIWGSNADAP